MLHHEQAEIIWLGFWIVYYHANVRRSGRGPRPAYRACSSSNKRWPDRFGGLYQNHNASGIARYPIFSSMRVLACEKSTEHLKLVNNILVRRGCEPDIDIFVRGQRQCQRHQDCVCAQIALKPMTLLKKVLGLIAPSQQSAARL